MICVRLQKPSAITDGVAVFTSVFDVRVLQAHVLGHRGLSAIALPAPNHVASIVAVDLVGAPPDSFLLVLSFLALLCLLEGCHAVSKFLFGHEGSLELTAQRLVGCSQPVNLCCVEGESLLFITPEAGNLDNVVIKRSEL